MTRPCQCGTYVGPGHPWGRNLGNCPLCYLYATSPCYRAAWNGQPVPPRPAPASAGIRQWADCRRLGEDMGLVPHPCKTSPVETVYHCELYGTCTRNRPVADVACCATCSHWRAQTPAPIFEARPGDPACGVVVGVYGPWAAALAELQVCLIRHTCGEVPILISDDASPGQQEALADVARRYPQVAFWSNPERIGHGGGDLAGIWKGLQWARARGLNCLAKLSQRFVPTRARWLQDGALELAASGLPLAGRMCQGRENWPVRTEAMLLDVVAWGGILAELSPRRWDLQAELVTDRLLRERLGGRYWPWSFLLPDKYARAEGQVWHCGNTARDYHELAARFGLRLPAGFHVQGWQRDKQEGRYVRG